MSEEKEIVDEANYEEYLEEYNKNADINKVKKFDKNVAYDVYEYLYERHKFKTKTLLPHLQPNRTKPFGSINNLVFPSAEKDRYKINYPASANQSSWETRSVDDVQRRDFSTYQFAKQKYREKASDNLNTNNIKEPEQEEADTEESQKFSPRVSKSEKLHMKLQQKQKKLGKKILEATNYRAFKKSFKINDFDILQNGTFVDINKHAVPWPSYAERVKTPKYRNHNHALFTKSSKTRLFQQYRHFSTESVDEINQCEFVKMNLNAKVKPQKKRLPKMDPSDCPCKEEEPLKDIKLNRLKKRHNPVAPKRVCKKKICPPRADDGLKMESKTLPQITMGEYCPKPPVYTDVRFKRLIKKPVVPPVCKPPCVGKECCPPRADDNLEKKKKVLPKLVANNCPCIDPEPLRDVKLKRLKPKPVKAPQCVIPKTCTTPRADEKLTIKQKVLPIMKPSDCPCYKPEPLKDAPRLKRFKKIEIEAPPNICIVEICDTPRADDGLKIELKKLPVLRPQDCPCLEDPPLAEASPLKRPKMRYIPKDVKWDCDRRICTTPRADDGLRVEKKTLPKIVPSDCPCIETVITDVPPLKKLIPKPVVEPKCIPPCVGLECCPPRADDGLKIKPKTLPVMKASNCPCIDPDPIKDVPPLVRLNLHVPEPIKECIKEQCPPRADANYKITPKKLPELKPPDCPCVEEEPLKSTPLKRLQKVDIPEPPKICPVDECILTPRADKDDWIYCKVTKTAEDKKDICKTQKREYNTNSVDRNNTTNIFASNLQILRNITNSLYFSNSIVPKDVLSQINFGRNIENSIKGKGFSTLPKIAQHNQPVRKNAINFKKMRSDGGNNSGHAKHNIPGCKKVTKKSQAAPADFVPPTVDLPNATYADLQPKHKMIKFDDFIKAPPQTTIDPGKKKDCLKKKMKETKSEPALHVTRPVDCNKKPKIEKACNEPQLTIWEKLINYFKARDCPSPEEFRQMRLKAEAEEAAAKAGLCIYDPKEMEKEVMPEIITPNCGQKKGGNVCKKQENKNEQFQK